MVLEPSPKAETRPALGTELLPGAVAALRQHVDSSHLGEEITPNVIKSLSSDGRLLESESSAALACLVLLAHESAGGEQASDAYPAVIAMECLLAAGDVLDDIQDGELDSKGWDSPAVAAETVAALLVLAHDALVAAIVRSDSGAGYVRALSRLTVFEARALRGQAKEVRTASSATTHAEGLDITRAKSGMLGRCAAEMGASIATNNKWMISQHGDFGEHIAVVFQLMNDVADIWLGLDRSTDLSNARPTTPLGFLSTLSGGATFVSEETDGSTYSSPIGEERRGIELRSGAVQFTWAIAAAELARARRKAHEIVTVMPASRLSLLLQH